MRAEDRCTDPEKGTRLAAYEMGLLLPDEQAAFEEHIAGCEACQEMLYEMSPCISTLQGEPGGIASHLAALSEPAARPRPRAWADWVRGQVAQGWPIRAWSEAWRALIPVAAVAAIVVVLIVPREAPHRLGDLAELGAVPHVQLQTRSGVTGEAAALFGEGIDLYRNEAYARAAALLARSARLAPPGDGDGGGSAHRAEQAAFFAGLSFLLAGRADSASPYLETASASSLRVLADRSHWYLAQACLLRDEADCAAAHLEILAAGSPGYQARAAQQLVQLRERVADSSP